MNSSADTAAPQAVDGKDARPAAPTTMTTTKTTTTTTRAPATANQETKQPSNHIPRSSGEGSPPTQAGAARRKPGKRNGNQPPAPDSHGTPLPETKQEDFYGSKFQRPGTIPPAALQDSVQAMNAARERNPYNQGVLGAACRHERVELWKLDQCADCKKNLGQARLAEEQRRAGVAQA